MRIGHWEWCDREQRWWIVGCDESNIRGYTVRQPDGHLVHVVIREQAGLTRLITAGRGVLPDHLAIKSIVAKSEENT